MFGIGERRSGIRRAGAGRGGNMGKKQANPTAFPCRAGWQRWDNNEHQDNTMEAGGQETGPWENQKPRQVTLRRKEARDWSKRGATKEPRGN